MASNISLKVDEGVFNHRAAAIIIQDGKILLCKNEGQENYYLIGGRVTFGEDSAKGIQREVVEELMINAVEVDRLLYVIENFFIFTGGGAKGKQCHELCMYYLMKLGRPITKELKPVVEENYTMHFHWVDLNDLGEIKLFPEILKTELRRLSHLTSSTKHFVTRQ